MPCKVFPQTPYLSSPPFLPFLLPFPLTLIPYANTTLNWLSVHGMVTTYSVAHEVVTMPGKGESNKKLKGEERKSSAPHSIFSLNAYSSVAEIFAHCSADSKIL